MIYTVNLERNSGQDRGSINILLINQSTNWKNEINNMKNEMNPEHSSQNAYMSIRDFELNVSNLQ